MYRVKFIILVMVTLSMTARPQAPASAGSNGGQLGSSQIVGHSPTGARSKDRNVPARDNLSAIDLGSPYASALIGGFEQGAGLPIGLELTTARKIPAIEFRVRALASTRLYQRFEAGIWIPAVGNERNHIDLWVGYRKRTRDNLFGLGSQSAERPETNFASIQRSLNLALLRDVAPGFQIGLYARLATENAFAGKERGTDDLPIDQMFSSNPLSPYGLNWLPGLNTSVKTLATGAFAEYDKRNNDVGLTKGLYLYGRLATVEGLRRDTFSDFGWLETELDGQAFLPLGSDYTSLAVRAMTTLRQPRGGSQIPFHELSWLGGRNQLRGYRNFRFRGNNALLLTIEPRRTLFKQSEIRGLDLFVFGDAGQVWGDNRPLANSTGNTSRHFSSSNWRYALGGGFQYRVNRTTAFRIDIGQGREGTRAFFSVSRGF